MVVLVPGLLTKLQNCERGSSGASMKEDCGQCQGVVDVGTLNDEHSDRRRRGLRSAVSCVQEVSRVLMRKYRLSSEKLESFTFLKNT